jgi:hypothetical protein
MNMDIQNTQSRQALLTDQAANVLLAATSEFLRRNKIADKKIRVISARSLGAKQRANLRMYRKLMGAYEYMGVLMATWFSNPNFLDRLGNPIAISLVNGPRSLGALIRASRIRMSKAIALQLLECSPSIRINQNGTLSAKNRVFILPEFEVARAALVVERYLDTLHKNFSSARGNVTLLERSCHVTGIDLGTATPILRNIKQRGAALMDVIDSEIEARRSRRPARQGVGELGVLMFAWTRPNTKRAR